MGTWTRYAMMYVSTTKHEVFLCYETVTSTAQILENACKKFRCVLLPRLCEMSLFLVPWVGGLTRALDS